MFKGLKGLSKEEVEKRLSQFGENSLPKEPSKTNLSLIVEQIKNPLAFVLLIAGITTLIINHIPDALIIFLSLFINTILGFIQEKKANESFKALKELVVNSCEVFRDGERKKINTEKLVPGDVVLLGQGSKVPADGKLLEVNRLLLDEAIMTGESISVSKKKGDDVYMGTTVLGGQAVFEVTLTGRNTKIGNIAKDVQSVESGTPLTKQLLGFSRKLLVLVIFLIAFVFIIGLIKGIDIVEIFTTSVALAVAAIPEGLVVSMTVVLALGMQRILKRQGLVRKLVSAETLGGVTTICVDKTGTLTEGKMKVVSVNGSTMDLSLQVSVANDLDDPILIAAKDWASSAQKDIKIEKYERLDSIPFSSKERFFVSLNKWDKSHNMIFVNGAPDILLSYTNLKKGEKDRILKEINEATKEGKRLLGLARKKVSNKKKTLDTKDAKDDLEWVGFLSLFDPVRLSVKDALKEAINAGIKIVVITGDYPLTAKYVLREVGIDISDSEILLGSDISELSEDELARKVKNTTLFARTTPDQKQLIVAAFQKSGEVVAMMGDGVNDAQAIHKADIGIVVESASDVARESADLVLLDSNFSTIVAAVEEGRGIFDNIRKIILYLLSDAFVEIIIVIGSIFLSVPLPVTAVQIIWVNLVSDGFPGLALTVDPKRAGIMNERPRSSKEKLVTNWMLLLMTTVCLFAGGAALLVFYISYKVTGDVLYARSLTFVTIGLNSMAYVFSVKSLLTPFWKGKIFENKYLIFSVMGGIMLQIIPFLTESTRSFFRVTPLTLSHWLLAALLSVMVFVVVEVFKTVWTKANLHSLDRL